MLNLKATFAIVEFLDRMVGCLKKWTVALKQRTGEVALKNFLYIGTLLQNLLLFTLGVKIFIYIHFLVMKRKQFYKTKDCDLSYLTYNPVEL